MLCRLHFLALSTGTRMVWISVVCGANSAQEKTDGQPAEVLRAAAVEQEIVRRKFVAWQQTALRLAHRYENGKTLEQRDCADRLRAALQQVDQEGIDAYFSSLAQTLNSKDAASLQTLESATTRLRELTDRLGRLPEMLFHDPREESERQIRVFHYRSRQIRVLTDELQTVLRSVRSRASDSARLVDVQKDIAEETRALLGKDSAPVPPRVRMTFPGDRVLEESLRHREVAEADLRRGQWQTTAATVLPSGPKATTRIWLVGPRSTRSSSPLTPSHSPRVSPSRPHTVRVPSGLKATGEGL